MRNPLVEPVREKKFQVVEKGLPETTYTKQYLHLLQAHPAFTRSIAIVGQLHHGKTVFMDMLVKNTHHLTSTPKRDDDDLRYTDTHLVERDRGASIKAMPMTLVLQSTKGKSHIFQLYDTPGHVNFGDEVAAAVRACDGAIVVVDAVEGVMMNTERCMEHLIHEGIPFTLIITKMDRLILELKLPPADAYFKLKHTIEAVNTIIVRSPSRKGSQQQRLSPEKGNVAFACSTMEWVFTLPSFAKLYSDIHGVKFDTNAFASRLWGDVAYKPETRTFHRHTHTDTRTFVHFVLEPLYKLHAQSIGETEADLKTFLRSELGIDMKKTSLKQDMKPLLKTVMAAFFGGPESFVDMCVTHLPSPVEGAAHKVAATYTGPSESVYHQAMVACDREGPLMIQTVKLYNSRAATEFEALGRVMSGSIRVGQRVRVLREKYTIDDPEDMEEVTISHLWIYESRYALLFITLESLFPHCFT